MERNPIISCSESPDLRNYGDEDFQMPFDWNLETSVEHDDDLFDFEFDFNGEEETNGSMFGSVDLSVGELDQDLIGELDLPVEDFTGAQQSNHVSECCEEQLPQWEDSDGDFVADEEEHKLGGAASSVTMESKSSVPIIVRENKIDLSQSAHSKLQVVGSFEEDVFVERYQRNNKCSGLKNLRCFPNCGPAHRGSKFCGQPITFRTIHSKDSSCVFDRIEDGRASVVLKRKEQPKELLAWGKFDKAEECDPMIQVGSIISRETIVSQERRRGQPFLPWYPSAITQRAQDEDHTKEVVDFQFNSEHQGWHYSWQATKYTCNLEHVFKVFVFTPVGDHHLVCVGIFDSPRFSIYCRRRRRFDRPDATDLLSPTTAECRLIWYVLSHLENIQAQEHELSDTESNASELCGDAWSVPSSPSSASPVSSPSPSQSSSSQSNEGSAKKKMNSVLQSFAKHIIEETAFTEKIKEISEQVSVRRDHGESIDTGFRVFLGIIRDYIQVFFRKHGVSMDDFERLEGFISVKKQIPLGGPTAKGAQPASSITAVGKKRSRSKAPQPKSESLGIDIPSEDVVHTFLNSKPEREVRCAFLELVDSQSKATTAFKRPRKAQSKVIEELQAKKGELVVEEKDLELSGYMAFNVNRSMDENGIPTDWIADGFRPNEQPASFSGKWLRDPATYQKLIDFRERAGIPWIRRKLLEMMECSVRFEHHANALHCYLNPKLLSDGYVEYRLDKKFHPFNFKDPIVGCSKPMAIAKQSFVEGNAIVLRHIYSETDRMTRILWMNNSTDELQGRAYFEQRLPQSGWKPREEFMFHARRSVE